MKNEPILTEDPQVKLKPILGIKPGIYLLTIYSLIVLGALYWLFLLPGLQNPGELYKITTQPVGSAVFFVTPEGKETYFGSTPIEAFLPEGKGRLEIRRTHFKTYTQDLVVGNRLFFSRFFPSTQTINISLTEGKAKELLTDFVKELSQWSMTTPSQSEYAYPLLFSLLRNKEDWIGVSYPLPPLFTQIKSDLLASGETPAEVQTLILDYLPWVTDPFLYQDLLNALNGPSPSSSFTEQMAFWTPLVPDRPGLGPWIMINQPWKNRNIFSRDPKYLETQSHYQEALKAQKLGKNKPMDFQLSGIEFTGVPGTTFEYGVHGSLSLEPPFGGSRLVTLEPFGLSTTEITQKQYEEFLKSHSEWAPKNKATLIAQGLADSRYLETWTNNQGPTGQRDYPVSGVSYYGARAFAQWVGGLNPGYEVRLPLDEEWEWAAQDAVLTPVEWPQTSAVQGLLPAAQGKKSALGLRGLSGQVWEWTDSDAAPGAYLIGPGNQPLSGSEDALKKSVRGGSFADNQVTSFKVRGAQDTSWSSPYLGFRLLARKK